MNEQDDLAWLTTSEASDFLAISRSGVVQLIKSGRLPERREGRNWFLPRAALEVRLAERLAAERPPAGYLYRTTLPATDETALTDGSRFGGLRYLYTPAQLEAVHVMLPGDRLDFPEDEHGSRWAVECLPAWPAGVIARWWRVPDSRSLTLDDPGGSHDLAGDDDGSSGAPGAC